MPKLPGVAPTSPAKQQQVSRYEANAEWTGPVDLGREAMLRDLALSRGWDLVDGERAEHQFLAWTGVEDGRFDEAVAALSPREAKGFAERTVRDVFERAKVFRESLPPSVRSAIDEGIAAYERNLFNKAAVVEDGAQLRAVRENLEAGLQATLIPAARAIAALPADDPDKLGRFTVLKAGRFALIDSNPALPPHEKKQRKAAEATAIDTAFAEALSPQEKQDLDPEAAIETFGARIHRLAQETQAADRAERDRLESSATGDGVSANPEGFGGEAWLDLIRRLRPDLAEGRNIFEIQALRADPKLAAEMREIGLADSARFLTQHGHTATPALLYLAHVTSREMALRLLQADPDSLAVDADPEVAPARPDLFHVDGDETRPRTAGEVIAHAEDAMAGTRPVDWGKELDGMSPGIGSALAADGREADARAATEAKLAEEEAYRRRIEETEQAIEAGTFGHADLVKAAGEGGWIKGEDFPRLFNLLVKRSADALEYDAALSKFLDPEYKFDLTSSDDQRLVDLLYEHGHPGDAVGITKGDTAAQLTLQEIVDRTGITPTQATEHATKADPVSENSGAPSEQIVRETKSDRFIPEYHKKFANFRAAIADSDVPSVLAGFGELRHQLLQAGIREAFGEGAVEKYVEVEAWADELLGDFREEVHRYVEEWNEGRSTLERANWKSLADGGIALGSAIFGSAGGGAKRGGGRHGRGIEYDLNPKTFQKLGYSRDDGKGNLLHVETRKIGGIQYRVFRVRTKQESGGSSDAAGAAEYKALNEPEANAIYELDNGKWFRTNEHQHVVELEFRPTDPMRGRHKLQTDVGNNDDSRKDDHGGHLQAKSLGGSSDRFNLFPQNSNFNLSGYKKMENIIRDNIDEIKNVKITLTRKNPKNSRPDELLVEFELNGRQESFKFPNEAGAVAE